MVLLLNAIEVKLRITGLTLTIIGNYMVSLSLHSQQFHLCHTTLSKAIRFKRGTEHSHRSLKVVGNPRYRYEIAAHARDA